MVPVESSNVKAVGYDDVRQIMKVEFKSGHSYTHANVPPRRHAEFMQATSKGSHYHDNFRGKYDVKKSRSDV